MAFAFQTSKGHTVYHYNGFRYCKNREDRATIYLRCVRFRKGCPAKVMIKNGHFVAESATGEHTHYPPTEEMACDQPITAETILKRKARPKMKKDKRPLIADVEQIRVCYNPGTQSENNAPQAQLGHSDETYVRPTAASPPVQTPRPGDEQPVYPYNERDDGNVDNMDESRSDGQNICKFYLNGCKYLRDGGKGSAIYFRCSKFRSGCKSRVTVRDGKIDEDSIREQHNHLLPGQQNYISSPQPSAPPAVTVQPVNSAENCGLVKEELCPLPSQPIVTQNNVPMNMYPDSDYQKNVQTEYLHPPQPKHFKADELPVMACSSNFEGYPNQYY